MSLSARPALCSIDYCKYPRTISTRSHSDPAASENYPHQSWLSEYANYTTYQGRVLYERKVSASPINSEINSISHGCQPSQASCVLTDRLEIKPCSESIICVREVGFGLVLKKHQH
jgi:hypothetical protein